MSAPIDARSMSRKSSSWADYYSRRRLFAYTLILGPVGILVAQAWFGRPTSSIALVVAWVAAVVVAGLYLQAFNCPRCDRRFFPRTPLLGLRARRCHRCMLPKE